MNSLSLTIENCENRNAPVSAYVLAPQVDSVAGSILGYMWNNDSFAININPFSFYAGNAKAIGYSSGVTISGENNLNPAVIPQAAAPTANYLNGELAYGTAVELTCDTSGVSIRYTTDGSTPTAASTLYTAPIVITDSTVIKAAAFHSSMKDSVVSEFYYVIELIPEDINGDGILDMQDIIYLSRYLASWQGYNINTETSDFNQDGLVDILNSRKL